MQFWFTINSRWKQNSSVIILTYFKGSESKTWKGFFFSLFWLASPFSYEIHSIKLSRYKREIRKRCVLHTQRAISIKVEKKEKKNYSKCLKNRTSMKSNPFSIEDFNKNYVKKRGHYSLRLSAYLASISISQPIKIITPLSKRRKKAIQIWRCRTEGKDPQIVSNNIIRYYIWHLSFALVFIPGNGSSFFNFIVVFILWFILPRTRRTCKINSSSCAPL